MIFILTQAPDNSRKTHHVTECEHCQIMLTHWGRVTNICVGNLTIIGSDNGLSPYRRQAIIWTNAGILLIGPLRTFSEILIYIQTFSFKKMHLKMSSAKWRPFCLGLNVLNGGGAEPLHQTKYKMPRSHTHQFARQISKWPHHSEIWQPSRQHFCQGSCQISEWYNHDKLVLHVYLTTRPAHPSGTGKIMLPKGNFFLQSHWNCVRYLSEYIQNGRLDRFQEKFR